MKVTGLFAVAALFALAGCANPGSGFADQERTVDVKVVDSVNSTEAKKDADPNEVICSRRHQVGSNFPRMVCKTRRELEQERRSSENALRLQQQRNAGGAVTPARN